MRRYGSLMACLLLLGAGCGESGGDNQNNNSACPEGFEQSGPACIPIFDDCPGAAEIPVLGGGCQQVGVTTCATGLFTSDGEGGCEPILPDYTCPPGTMEMLGQTECQPVGVTECAAGFESDGEGGCNAILPPDPCPHGTIALLGYTTCQPLGDCGTTTWGNIVDDGTTVYVDQTADATGADGSQQAPFVTIGEALAAVVPGGQIAVAEGDYTERLNINKEVRLTGRCAALVTIRGRYWLGAPKPPVSINVGGTATTIRGVTLTGPTAGLGITGAQQVVVQQVQVWDGSEMGIVALEGGEVSLQQVVVSGCAAFGVYSHGSVIDIEESVVQNTRPHPGTGEFGRGVDVECSPTGICGSLRVSSSLVSGNRNVGIFAWGVDTEVTATVVRNTVGQESDGVGGRGISAACHPDVVDCGSLWISSSVVSDNRYTGVFSFGVDTEISSTVIRDTQPDADNTGGGGIHAQCYPDHGTCGSLRISSSLISGNRVSGIVVSGLDTEVTATVVRDTLSEQSTGDYGGGIAALCHREVGACGSLRVSSCLVSGNRNLGIGVRGVDTEVTSTVVRDTLSEQSTSMFGRGIGVQCDAAVGACGSLQVSSSLVSGNRDVGIDVDGVDTEVTSTVVRDTLSSLSDGTTGRGIHAQCSVEARACGSLQVSSSLVTGNRELGISAAGADTEITGTVVRETVPAEGTGGGRGINAQCSSPVQVCGSLQVSSCMIVSSEDVGIFISGVPAILERVAVIDTLSNAQGSWQGVNGHGIYAACSDTVGDCGTLSVMSCLVDSCQSGGVSVEGVSGILASSVVRSVAPQPLDERYGYGIQIGGMEGQQGRDMSVFDVNNCVISDARLSGILYYRARGTVSGSVVSGGENSVVMNEGSEPTILDNNDLSGTVTNEPTWASLYPCPAPAPALPVDPADPAE